MIAATESWAAALHQARRVEVDLGHVLAELPGGDQVEHHEGDGLQQHAEDAEHDGVEQRQAEARWSPLVQMLAKMIAPWPRNPAAITSDALSDRSSMMCWPRCPGVSRSRAKKPRASRAMPTPV